MHSESLITGVISLTLIALELQYALAQALQFLHVSVNLSLNREKRVSRDRKAPIGHI